MAETSEKEKNEQNSNEVKVENDKDDDTKNNDKEDEKNEEPIYKVLKKEKLMFEETTESGEIKVAAGKIAKAITAAIGAYATGGSLSSVLATQLENAVINIEWKTSEKNESIVKQFFENNTYLFVSIDREISQKSKKFMGMGQSKYEIKAPTRFFYAESGNDAATKELQSRANKEKDDAFKWIDNHKVGSWI
eukprot:357177_1